MKIPLKACLSLILASILCYTNSTAQTKLSDRFVSFTAAYSPQSMFFLGKTPDSQTYNSYIGLGKKINPGFTSLSTYRTIGIIPFIQYHYPKRDDSNRMDVVTGFGISPLGYQFLKPINQENFLNFGIKSGIMFMEKFFPTDKARRLNYTFDLSFSLQRFVLPKTSVSLGYKFHHISNAQTGKHNPGVDSNFIFITLKRFSNGN